MSDPYRAPPGESMARLDGDFVVIRDGVALPRLCVLCGGRKKLNDRQVRFDEPSGGMTVGPVWLLAAVALLRVVHRELEKSTPARLPLQYTCCSPCERRARDAEQLHAPLGIAGLVGALGAATAGFNGAPVLGVGILFITVVAVWVAYRKLVRGRNFSVRRRLDGVALGGIHGDAVQALLALRIDAQAPPPS